MTSLILDDERLARAELRRLRQAHPDVELLGETEDVEPAVKLMEEVNALDYLLKPIAPRFARGAVEARQPEITIDLNKNALTFS